MAANPQKLIGQWVPGGYRIQRFIGAGAFAWVYYATNAQGEAAAIKVLQAPTDEARTLFQREMKVLRALPQNPYCVAYIDDGVTDDGMLFLVMEYIDGATLKDAFKFKPVWQVEEACHLTLQLCEALAGLHRLGVAHRDLKPENVMLIRDWRVKLMDFGLVKDAQGLLQLFEKEDILTGKDFAENIDRAMLAGTPEYMAPEQFSDPMVEDESQAKTDTWSDVYSLGLIFFQLVTGQKLFPFKPQGTDQKAYARSLLAYIKERTGFDDANLQRPDTIPHSLWVVLARSLKQNPKQRFHNAVEFGDAIRKYLDTGEADEFGDDEHTSMADMATLMAGLGGLAPLRPGASSGANAAAAAPASNASRSDPPRPRSVRPPSVQESTKPVTKAALQPALDVAAVKAYSDERLNKVRPEYTLPPGALFANQIPAPVAQPRSGATGANMPAFHPQESAAAAATQMPQSASAQQSGGGVGRALAMIFGALILAVAAGAATYFLMLKR
jgi:serine/threonine protein kinase